MKRYYDTWRYGTPYNTRRTESFQQMTFGNHTITLSATLPNLYEIIAEVKKTLTDKPRKPIAKTTPLPLFVEQVRVGSHKEWVEIGSKEHGYHKTVEEYTTVYDDCLPGKEWLKVHEHDPYPEPTIDISVDSGKSISLNGNYKRGMIKEFIKANRGS